MTKKPGWAFWTTVVLAIPVLYVVSIGPACWLVDRGWVSSGTASRIFKRIVIAAKENEWLLSAVNLYAKIGAERSEWTITRLMDAAGLIPLESGFWPED